MTSNALPRFSELDIPRTTEELSTPEPAPAASYTLPQTGIVAAPPAPIVVAPAPVVECTQAAPTFQTAPVTVTVTGVDMNRDGTPDVLQQPQVGYSAPVQYGAPVGAAPTFQIQDVLKLTVRELDILRTAEEFSTLDLQIRLKFPFSVPGILVLPETFSIDSFSVYISVFMRTDTLRRYNHLAHRVRGKTTCILVRASKASERSGGVSRR